MDKITLHMPCWTIFDPVASEREGMMNLAIAEVQGKNCLALFINEEEAKRYIQAVGMTNHVPTSFETKASLVKVLTEFQARGLHEVQYFERVANKLKRHDFPVGDFLQGLEDGSIPVILGTFRLSRTDE